MLILSLIGGYLALNKKIDLGKPDNAIVNSYTEGRTDGCLMDNEYADYPLNPKVNPKLKHPQVPIIVHIRDNGTSEVKDKFEIDNILEHANIIELHACHLYVLRNSDYDYTKQKAGPNYKAEIWRYNYNGNGEPAISLGESISGVYIPSGLSNFFSVSPDEKYIVLERSYLGKDDYALVIKNLNSKEDAFVLPISTIAKDNPYSFGSLEMRGWTKDGKYFWGATFDGAYMLSFFRIERDAWRVDVFETPINTLGGDVLNLENGYVTHNTLSIWTGVYEMDQEIKEQYQKEGKTGIFSIYNLFTEQDIVLEKVSDPTIRFKDFQWLSDTELEYTLPSGERKVYTLK